MPNDIFGGFTGLMKGLSGFMPQDDPDVRIMNAQTEINELKTQETTLYAELGKAVLARSPGQFPEQEGKLKLIRANIAETQTKLADAQGEKMQKEKAQQMTDAQFTCPSCGLRNPDGVKFCQDCGAKLGVSLRCPSCGVEIAKGVRFCGACGAKVE